MRDAQLVRRIQAGDRRAADALIERYYTDVLRYCARHTACTQTAEDLTQEVFLHLFRTIGSYPGTGTVPGLSVTGSPTVCAWMPPGKEKADPLPEDLADPAAPFEAIENRDLAQRLLAGLPPEQREAILLRLRAGAEIPRDRSGHGAAAAHRAEPCAQSPENVKGGNPMNSTDLQRLLCQGPRPTRLAQTPTKMRRAAAGNPRRGRAPGSGPFSRRYGASPGCRCGPPRGAAARAVFSWRRAGQKDLVSLAAAAGAASGGRCVCRSCLLVSATTWMNWKHPPVCPVRNWHLPSWSWPRAADLVLLTSALALGRSPGRGRALLPLFFYLLVPFLFCALTLP